MPKEALSRILGVRITEKTFRELETLREHLGLWTTSEVVRFLMARGLRIWKQEQEPGDGRHPQI